MKRINLIRLTLAALCLSLCLLLPFLTANSRELGNLLCLMHIPVLLCGLLCGWQYGVVVGFAGPLLRCFTIGMPVFTIALPMSFELAVYGLVSALVFSLWQKRSRHITAGIYISLVSAMLCGRFVSGVVKYLLAIASPGQFSFAFPAFMTATFITTLPGIAIQLVLIPALLLILTRAKLFPLSAYAASSPGTSGGTDKGDGNV